MLRQNPIHNHSPHPQNHDHQLWAHWKSSSICTNVSHPMVFLTFYPGIMTPIYPKYSKWILALWEVDTNHIFKARPLAAFRPAGVQRAMAHEMHACASSTRSCAVGQGCGWRMRWSNKIWVDKNVLRHCEGWNSGQYFRTIRCFKMFKERNFAELHYFGHESDNWQT
jgi:hypothetical protein